jgi:sortase A
MRSKILSRRTLLIVVFTGFAVSLALLFYFIPKKSSVRTESAPPTENSAALPKQTEENIGLPLRLTIQEINVDAAIEQVGLTSDGLMDAPKGPAEVGWFNRGPRPGDKGSAVIAGHSGWKNNIPAVFDNLENIKPGDKVTVQDDKGAVISFVVRESRRYDPEADASDVFRSNDGKAYLNLITCVGVWNKLTKSRSERLVVFTERE